MKDVLARIEPKPKKVIDWGNPVREYSTKPPERSHFGSVFLCENLKEICYDVYRVEVVI